MKKKDETLKLVGVAIILDMLWDNCYYGMGKDASKRLQREMEYYFGDNPFKDMYDFMDKYDTGDKKYRYQIKTMKELKLK
jgi:hypothetical protein